MTNLDFEAARLNMIEHQIRPWDVLDQKVLDVMAAVPREDFVTQEQRPLAFADVELPLGHGEFMMPPRVEGRMLQALRILESDVVLEIGTGSGYPTACLAALASHVYTVEIHEDLAVQARERVTALGKTNVTWQQGDAAYGWREAPGFYDVIAVTGSLPEYDPCFEEQLKPGGRLFIVVGEEPVMNAMLVTRIGDNGFTRETLFEVELKPLVGREKKPEFVL
jgi:protein-L-isoaspartate(D-aspartate) O-methyltransferase